ncbi:trypsin-like peptidase domain-containing protein [Streptomyces sp. RS2]|uniref:trypsin-like peptidase domain-containing protein n=1 Tax=Streptomyces sp. RS2 TaxID=1451205 RepID=UPI0021F86BBB|nr:trypsin-like peptidase domain-containing protein [Streptomyces sp. RS2]MCW1100074.1 trypsin-like peptidase domain-containing protein [Streptomyces sp. RS2]
MTARIALPDSGPTLGTGVAIAQQGLIVTCRHVLDAGGLDVRASEPPQVEVFFPAVDHYPAFNCRAETIAYTPDKDDDLVCLKAAATLPSGRVAVLGDAAASEWNEFISYGYRTLGKYHGLFAQGTIMGEIEAPVGHSLLKEPIQLRSSDIAEGMSGAAVLDRKRNLVVGMVSEKWGSDGAAEDRDTAWAVNAHLVTFPPFSLVIRDDPLPMLNAEPPHMNEDLLGRAVPPASDRLDDAPGQLAEWVGREPLLAEADRAAEDPESLVVSLIGFGGEGKTSIARQWIERRRTVWRQQERTKSAAERPRAFWWSFAERPGADDFLEAALDFVSGGRISAADCEDGRARAEIVASLLHTRPYLFVLDGLEVVQEQRGDQYGTVLSPDLRDFLTFFATPGHSSFCLITSRAPVVDLIAFMTHRQVDVPSLTAATGRELLSLLGVRGSDAALERVAEQWGGHALTLSLIAAYLVKRYGGDVRRIGTLPKPDPDLPRAELVRHILSQYDGCLSDTERALLTGFSVFRTPVEGDALETVLTRELPPAAPAQVRTYTTALVHLVDARVIRRDQGGRLGLHPLVRDYYYQRAAGGRDRARLHEWAKNYYLRLADSRSEPPSALEDLAPLVEAVHHACRSDAYAEAYTVITNRLYAGDRGLITRELNAYDLVLASFADFFPRGDFRREPHTVSNDPGVRGWVLHEVATSLQMLGRLWEAVDPLRRAEAALRALGRFHQAAVSCQNRTELHLALGQLAKADEALGEAADLAARAGDQEDVLVAETLRGALYHHRGQHDQAERSFATALDLARQFTPVPILYSRSGVYYAEHLRATGRAEAAREAHEANLRVCRRAGWAADEAFCLIGLGDLALDRAAHAAGGTDRPAALHEAEELFKAAYDIARGITRREVLIASLLARCRLATATGQSAGVRELADKALAMALSGGYRIAEVEARTVLARVYREMGDDEAAWDEISRATETAREIGYQRGEDAALGLESTLRDST